MRKLSLAAVAAMLLALPATAQDLQASYEKKLAKEFAQKTAWVQKLTDAQAKAAESNKLILGYFSRSYAP
jgi:ribosomal protein S17E